MHREPRNPTAGGLALAVGAITGALIGARHGQPSAGLLIGLGCGAVVALAAWLMDRKRS